ncbi:MAG: hypothetical protein ACI8WT_000052 [Clostridium sp.]|jgi:hypothetical protein
MLRFDYVIIYIYVNNIFILKFHIRGGFSVLTITIQVVAILSMLTFMFIGIWSFILLIKIFYQLRYKNYLMEKLIQSTSKLSFNNENREGPKDSTLKHEKEILES